MSFQSFFKTVANEAIAIAEHVVVAGQSAIDYFSGITRVDNTHKPSLKTPTPNNKVPPTLSSTQKTYKAKAQAFSHSPVGSAVKPCPYANASSTPGNAPAIDPANNIALIKKYLEQDWDAHKGDCSGYLKAVSAHLGISLSGQANDIVDTMHKPPWTSLGNDPVAALQHATAGELVVAGLKEAGNGHVAIIVPGPMHNGYPYAYWGMLDSVGMKDQPLTKSFYLSQLQGQVEYFSIPIPKTP